MIEGCWRTGFGHERGRSGPETCSTYADLIARLALRPGAPARNICVQNAG